jgi:hypothetical protein
VGESVQAVAGIVARLVDFDLPGLEHVDLDLVSAGVMALAVIIAVAVIRIRRQDLSGADPMAAPAGDTTTPSRA